MSQIWILNQVINKTVLEVTASQVVVSTNTVVYAPFVTDTIVACGKKRTRRRRPHMAS